MRTLPIRARGERRGARPGEGKCRMRVGGWMLLAAVLLAARAEASPRVEYGRRFADRACAGCHAVGVSGSSRQSKAPPFRTLPGMLPGRRLASELRTISAHGHRDMPPIYMTPAERRAVAAYIRAVARRAQQRDA